MKSRKKALGADKLLQTALPRPGDPLVMADGRVLRPESPTDVFNIDDKSDLRANIEPHEYKPTTRRSLKDFPANPTMLNAISVVFAYTMYGLSNVEICNVLNLSSEQLEQLRQHRGYSELFTAIMNEFINANSEILQSRIAAYSHSAVSKVGYLIANAKKEEVQLSASKDMLDRAGARPQDLANQQAATMDGLRISIIKNDKDVSVELTINGTDLDLESESDRMFDLDEEALKP
jgi:hypothetical protein